ncbi:hypothetical protein BDR07DRAFT_1489309 [Suillus spraguei]|nr:hypothetical protein BDR07DRAFT_1489309 [Suillus spraguei]
MNYFPAISANNIDVDMQHPEFQQEDIQTSHDTHLFGDDEDNDKGPGDFMDVLSQPPTSVPRLEKRAREEVISGKRRIQEVDYSQVLRQTVYEQQECINNIIEETEVIHQEAQDHIEEQRRLAEEEHERRTRDFNERWEKALREQEREKQEIHTWQEQQQALLRKNVAEELAQHEAKISAKKDRELAEELARHNADLDTRKNQELEEHERAIFAEMEQRLQLEIEKMRVEKENELANMEQRFARHGRQQHAATEIGTDPTQRNAQQPPHTPQKPQLKTPCLEMIKKIRKARGTTRKMRLVSVVEDADEPMETHQERSSTIEQEPQRFQPDDVYPMSVMENAISKGIEAALRRILVDKDILTSTKHSPRRKKKQDDEIRIERAADLSHERDFLLGEIRRLLKDTFSISQDADFIVHQPADRGDVYSYEYEDGPGPNTQNLAFDLKHRFNTPWNAKILNILLEELKKRSVEEEWPFWRSDAYYKVTAKGCLETAEEVKERLIAKRGENLKSVCQTTCRRNKYLRRAKVLEQVIELKKDGEDDDLPAWQWLQKLVKMLGDGGMSSKESDIENDVECVLRVKNMASCRGIERELNIIDNQRVLDNDIFAPQGSKPMKRIRASGNSMTVRNPVTGLPKALYNGRWIDGLTGGQVERLNVSDETFRWMKVGVA